MSWSSFLAALPPTRVAGNPVLPNSEASGGWHNGNVCDYSIVTNPLDPSELLMFFSGFRLDDLNNGGIGRATASATAPTVWTEYSGNPVMSRGSGGSTYDTGYIRLNNVWVEGTRIWASYTGGTSVAGSGEGTCIAYSDDGGISWTKHSSRVLTPTGTETTVSQAHVYKEGSTYYQFFSYRQSYGGGTPIRGIKVATASSPTGPWTRQGGDLLPNYYYEWHQVIKLDDGTYVMTYERPSDEMASGTAIWTLRLATATDPLGPWTSETSSFLSGSGVAGSFDEVHVATGSWYLLNGQWYLAYAGGANSDSFGYSVWQGGMASSSYPEGVTTTTTTTTPAGTTTTTTTAAGTTTTTPIATTTTPAPTTTTTTPAPAWDSETVGGSFTPGSTQTLAWLRYDPIAQTGYKLVYLESVGPMGKFGVQRVSGGFITDEQLGYKFDSSSVVPISVTASVTGGTLSVSWSDPTDFYSGSDTFDVSAIESGLFGWGSTPPTIPVIYIGGAPLGPTPCGPFVFVLNDGRTIEVGEGDVATSAVLVVTSQGVRGMA